MRGGGVAGVGGFTHSTVQEKAGAHMAPCEVFAESHTDFIDVQSPLHVSVLEMLMVGMVSLLKRT